MPGDDPVGVRVGRRYPAGVAPLFYLGIQNTGWLGRLNVPMFVSHRCLKKRLAAPAHRLPRAVTDWALDSGGFSELSMYGTWRTKPAEYAEAVQCYQDEIGRLAWAAPMDWMCEPEMLANTGFSIEQHQGRTVESVLLLRDHAPDVPWIPVLQGWDIDDYLICVIRYLDAGIDLTTEPIVGIGSVCRRQRTDDIGVLFRTLHRGGINCHGFGVKTTGFRTYGRFLTSADSMAWAYDAWRSPPLPTCTHRKCTDCVHYALRWRDRVLGTDDHDRIVREADAHVAATREARRQAKAEARKKTRVARVEPNSEFMQMEGWRRWCRRTHA